MYSWTVKFERTISLPDRDMVFDSPEDAWQYFQDIQRVYRVVDTNAEGRNKEYDNFEEGWKAYCAAVVGYVKFFPQLQQIPGNPSLSIRLDLPDPRKLEPLL